VAEGSTQRVVIDIDRWKALFGLLIMLFTVGGSVWGATGWAVQYKVDQEVAKEIALLRSTFATTAEVENARELQALRNEAMERQIGEMHQQIQYLYKREIERARGGG
jgi:hypothetical protein